MPGSKPLFALVALLAPSACGSRRDPQSMADFAGGVLLELPPASTADPEAVGGAFFEALVGPEVPRGEVNLEPLPGLALTCAVRHHQLRVSVLAITATLDPSRFTRAECPIGGITLPVTIVW